MEIVLVIRSTSSLFNEQPPTEFQALISSNKYFNNFSHKRKWAHDRICSGGWWYCLLVCFAIMVVCATTERLYVYSCYIASTCVRCHGLFCPFAHTRTQGLCQVSEFVCMYAYTALQLYAQFMQRLSAKCLYLKMNIVWREKRAELGFSGTRQTDYPILSEWTNKLMVFLCRVYSHCM